MDQSKREQRVTYARKWDRAWHEEVEALRATDSLYYELSLINEGYGDSTPYLLPLKPGEKPRTRAERRAALYANFEREQRERLSVLTEARPEAAVTICEEWNTWWQRFSAT